MARDVQLENSASARRELCGGAHALASEFAAVSVSIDLTANGPRLLVRDLVSDATAYLEPLELASFCLATSEDRAAWLEVGAYRVDAVAIGDSEH